MSNHNFVHALVLSFWLLLIFRLFDRNSRQDKYLSRNVTIHYSDLLYTCSLVWLFYCECFIALSSLIWYGFSFAFAINLRLVGHYLILVFDSRVMLHHTLRKSWIINALLLGPSKIWKGRMFLKFINVTPIPICKMKTTIAINAFHFIPVFFFLLIAFNLRTP